MIKENEKKEFIIKNVRTALLNKNTVKTIVHEGMRSGVTSVADDPSVVFVENFIKQKGNILYSTTEDEIKLQLERILNKYPNYRVSCSSDGLTLFFNSLGLDRIQSFSSAPDCEVGIIPCESIIANNASVLISSGQGELIFPKVLVLFAFTSQAVNSWRDAVARLKCQYMDKLPDRIIEFNVQNPRFETVYMLLTED